MTKREFDPQVKQLLDGELTLADLPAELRQEGEEALRLLAAVDRERVSRLIGADHADGLTAADRAN